MADVQKIDPVMEKPWQRLKRFQRYDYFRKSAYPPMQIEPMPMERNRLAGDGMTPEQRALRKQWVQDQAVGEPRNVRQLQPYNIFRRIYRYPGDMLIYKPLLKMFNHGVADVLRYGVPKIMMVFFGSYFLWYHIKYHKSNWLRDGGIIVYEGKPMLFGDAAKQLPPKDKTDYFDQGFKSRKALLYKPPSEA